MQIVRGGSPGINRTGAGGQPLKQRFATRPTPLKQSEARFRTTAPRFRVNFRARGGRGQPPSPIARPFRPFGFAQSRPFDKLRAGRLKALSMVDGLRASGTPFPHKLAPTSGV